ncbi:MAG: hypothetical protein J3Q66DRAFT_91350 [Benniella sp.]|nr:MAG: hypothetical protein J3Q66DRAFT_91350 [Benniella sp.]
MNCPPPHLNLAQDSSTYEDDRASSPVPRKRHESEGLSDREHERVVRRKVNSPLGSGASSFDSSSDDDDDDDDDDVGPTYKLAKKIARNHDDMYDSFEEVNGSDSSAKRANRAAPRTSKEFKNVDADLYDLRRSGRSRKPPKILDDDDDEEDDENGAGDEESDFENEDDDASDSETQDDSDDGDSDYGYGGKTKSARKHKSSPKSSRKGTLSVSNRKKRKKAKLSITAG